MLGIATPELFDGVGQAIANCQTYEGGLSAASHPLSNYEQETDGATFGEAHGGYAFCAMASHLSLSLLPNTARPQQSPFKSSSSGNTASFSTKSQIGWTGSDSASSSDLDVDKALRWAVSQQGIFIEGGGFRGRTNKLVDGCYGWFSGGGMFTILSALTTLRYGTWWRDEEQEEDPPSSSGSSGENVDDWESIGDDGEY